MQRVPTSNRAAELCGILAPASFIGGWAICGALRSGYDPVQQAISQLAREGTPGRLGMTAGFLGFGFLLPVFAQRLPELLGAGSTTTAAALRAAVVVAGASTLAVAAFPLQHVEGGTGDLLHELSAGVGYLAMIAAPALGALALRRSGHRSAAAASAAVSALAAASLGLSLGTDATGLWQRSGLGVVDVWFGACALWALRRPASATLA